MTRTELFQELKELYGELTPFEKNVICQRYKNKYDRILDEDYMKFLKVFENRGIEGLKEHLKTRKKKNVVAEVTAEDVKNYVK